MNRRLRADAKLLLTTRMLLLFLSHILSICGCVIPILSMTACGMQYTGLTAPTVSSPSRLRPATPNRVWKGSGRSPGRSEMPPVSESWEARMSWKRERLLL